MNTPCPSIRDGNHKYGKLRILVLGDPGVGKTSLVYLLAHDKVCSNVKQTCGCNIEILAHRHENKHLYLIELWDIGTHPKFHSSLGVFYRGPNNKMQYLSPSYHDDIDELSSIGYYKSKTSKKDDNQVHFHGIILVYDVQNHKNFINLSMWISEVMREIGYDNDYVWDRDIIYHNGQYRLPLLIVGTKIDLIVGNDYITSMEELGLNGIHICTQDTQILEEDHFSKRKINSFFENCISNKGERKQHQARRNSHYKSINKKPFDGWSRHTHYRHQISQSDFNPSHDFQPPDLSIANTNNDQAPYINSLKRIDDD